MIKTSEYCAVGHPDRTCDYIASYILDRYLTNDPTSRVALEVQLKDHFATVSGEVTSAIHFTDKQLADFVREAIRRIGYDASYQEMFGKDNAISADQVEVTLHISQQSPDIAQGVNKEGWGDQGIFFGLAVKNPTTGNMPLDYYLARKIANDLYRFEWGGHDIKTQVTTDDGEAIECVVAIPMWPKEDHEVIEGYIRDMVKRELGENCKVIVNGTGRYVTHGSIGDCGTTGRKLVVDFYGGNAKIGGGSPWGKDPTKADVTLNMLARKKALEYMKSENLDEVTCAISCCIGRSEIRVSYFNSKNELLETRIENDPPSHIIDELKLREPKYAERCVKGLFGYEA